MLKETIYDEQNYPVRSTTRDLKSFIMNEENDELVIQKLNHIFKTHADKRILVLGTTCAGKSTLVEHFPESRDQDDICWALLPKELEKKLSGGPWTEELVNAWNNHVENAIRIVEIEPGRPLFAGSFFKSDIIIYLNVNEKTLRERTKKRGMTYETASDYNDVIKEKLLSTDLPVIFINI